MLTPKWAITTFILQHNNLFYTLELMTTFVKHEIIFPRDFYQWKDHKCTEA